MNSIVCFGEALIDFHSRADTKGNAPPAFVPHPGGAPANVAVAVAHLGGDARFAGMLGNDMFGDMLLGHLHEAGVDTRAIRRTDAANTALAFVKLDDDGERHFSFYRPPSADLLFRADDFDPDLLRDIAVFHAGSCSLTEAGIADATCAGMQRARDNGALVTFDINLRPPLWANDCDPAQRLWPAMALAHVVKVSAEEMAFLADDAGDAATARARLWRGGTRLLLITDGTAAPLRWFTPDRHGSLPVFKVRARDSTGAGDAFVGGIVHGLASAGITPDSLDAFVDDAERRDAWLRQATACGALAVTRVGSFSAMPSMDAVRAFIDQHTALD